MNKYQKAYMARFGSNLAYIYSADFSKKYFSVKYDTDTIKLQQDEDITIEKYLLVFNIEHCIEDVLIYYSSNGKSWEEIQITKLRRGDREYTVRALRIDFMKPIKSIKVEDTNNLIDPIIFPVEYVWADKEKYYAKKAEETKQALLARAQVKHATGADLVNIYFQPCSDDYFSTTIILYQGNMLMAKYKVDPEVFFKSIAGLAYGEYFYEVVQYDKDGKELIKTDKIKFFINKPNYGGRPTVVI